MKGYKYTWWVLAALCWLEYACADESENILPPEQLWQVSEDTIVMNSEGQSCKVVIESVGRWSINGMTDWCRVDRERGMGGDTVTVSVDAYVFRENRMCGLVVQGEDGEKSEIIVVQSGALEDYLYRLPVVFHVLYQDFDDINQNIGAEYLTKILPYCNALYRQGGNGLDMGVEFYMALSAPDGSRLVEPGIHRVQWDKENVSVYDFMQSSDAEDVELIWDPNEYINVVVFPFQETNMGLSGISTMPFTVSEGGLAGLQAGDMYFEHPFREVYCVALNSWYAIRPDAKQIVAHELGHYLGLFHVFSDADELQTDYCADTPNYNRQSYIYERDRIIEEEGEDSPRLYERKGDDGKIYISRNVMDYEYTYQDEFTADQYKRIRHVLENSPLIPGIKKSRRSSVSKCNENMPRVLFME